MTLVLFVLYALGVVAWLALGLLPVAAAHVGQFQTLLLQLKVSHAGWATVISRILDRGSIDDSVTAYVMQYVFSALNLVLGVVLIAQRSSERVPRLLAFALLGTAATFNMPSHQVFHVIGDAPVIPALHFAFHIVSGLTYMWAVVLFPDGRLPAGLPGSRTASRVVVVMATLFVTTIAWRSSFINHPVFFIVYFGILIPALAIPVQTLRIARSTDITQQQQARLFRSALLPALVVGMAWIAFWLTAQTGGSFAASAATADLHLEDVFPVVFALVPVMLFIAIVRYRLWDFDTIMSRTLLYGSIIGALGAIYIVVVSVVGQITGSDLWSTVLAISVAGVAIEAVRSKLKGLVNRVVFGQEMSPAEAMRALAQSLDQLSPAGELAELTRVTVNSTRAKQARLWLVVEDHLLPVAQWPPATAPPGTLTLSGEPSEASCVRAIGPPGTDLRIPIYHQNRVLGVLAVSLPPGVGLPRSEERLVRDLAAQAGLLVHNAKLTAELSRYVERLSRQTRELQRSRQRVVAAHDAERRHLERNLHDGAQQELVALLVNLRTVLLSRTKSHGGSDDQAQELLVLRDMMSSMSITLRELCAGGVPAALTATGVSTAIDAAANPARRAGLTVLVNGNDLPRLPLDVEAAIYFCCLEALQNATKHAQATEVVIEFSVHDDAVEFSIRDNGIGFDPAVVGTSSGLTNMVERLCAVGGSLAIESSFDPADLDPDNFDLTRIDLTHTDLASKRCGTAVLGKLPRHHIHQSDRIPRTGQAVTVTDVAETAGAISGSAP